MEELLRRGCSRCHTRREAFPLLSRIILLLRAWFWVLLSSCRQRLEVMVARRLPKPPLTHEKPRGKHGKAVTVDPEAPALQTRSHARKAVDAQSDPKSAAVSSGAAAPRSNSKAQESESASASEEEESPTKKSSRNQGAAVAHQPGITAKQATASQNSTNIQPATAATSKAKPTSAAAVTPKKGALKRTHDDALTKQEEVTTATTKASHTTAEFVAPKKEVLKRTHDISIKKEVQARTSRLLHIGRVTLTPNHSSNMNDKPTSVVSNLSSAKVNTHLIDRSKQLRAGHQHN